jgi:hypothetical protein
MAVLKVDWMVVMSVE